MSITTVDEEMAVPLAGWFAGWFAYPDDGELDVQSPPWAGMTGIEAIRTCIDSWITVMTNAGAPESVVAHPPQWAIELTLVGTGTYPSPYKK